MLLTEIRILRSAGHRPFACALLVLFAGVPPLAAQDPAREEIHLRLMRYQAHVGGGYVEPRWLGDGSSFWYIDGPPGGMQLVRVDPVANSRQVLLTEPELLLALQQQPDPSLAAAPLPFRSLAFEEDHDRVRVTVAGREVVFGLATRRLDALPAAEGEEDARHTPRLVRPGNALFEADPYEVLSPDGRWLATVRDRALGLRSPGEDGFVALSSPAEPDVLWGGEFLWNEGTWAWWSPDARRLAVKRADYRALESIPIVDWLARVPSVEFLRFHYPGRGFPVTEIHVFDLATGGSLRLRTDHPRDHFLYVLGWTPAGDELLVLRSERTYKRWDVLRADTRTGAVRTVLTETAETFVRHPLWARAPGFRLLADGRRFLWMSERDGWDHIYLYGIDGTLLARLTEGEFPVAGIVAVDEPGGWLYFTAFSDRRRPYDRHLHRVPLEGGPAVRLTGDPGYHVIAFAPSGRFYVDVHSAPDRPPVSELRSADGRLLQVLSEMDGEALASVRWRAPEEFVVKAADGETDLYGLLHKPYDFDPDRRYPVINSIYAGPQAGVMHTQFSASRGALAHLGFIVIELDARGTPNRGKRFQDVVHRNFGRHEIPDHTAALRQLAAQRPYMDTERVGVVGGSFGGYFVLRALLLEPDVYHVGVARALHPDALDSGLALEPYMDLPHENPDGYAYADNIPLVPNLRGRLLIVHGTDDRNTPLGGVMRLIDALARAEKPYELLLAPGHAHAIRGSVREYADAAVRRFLVEHLRP